MVRREKFANGTPEPKPERTFADKLRTLKEVSKGIAPESRLRLLDYFLQEALEKKQITKDQASGIYEQLSQDKDKIREQIDAYDRVNFSEGSKDEQRKIADDEYYASLQKIIERDPAAKKFFNPDDITYPAMDRSGEYNYRGVQVQTSDLDKFKKYAEKRGLDQILSPESTFERKIEKGQFPVGLFTEPVQTGSEPGDLDKISTMLHEARHRVLMNPEFSKIIDQYGLDEEIFVRYLDKEFFPELEQQLMPPSYRKLTKDEQKYFDMAYGMAVKDYKKKFKRDDLKEKFVAKVKSFFADGGRAGFKDGTETKLTEFVKTFKETNNRAPTIMEVAKGSKSSTASVKKYLEEGVDFTKTDLSEVGKAGGTASGAGKKTGVTKLDNKAYKELQGTRIKGISFGVNTGVGGSKSVQLVIQNPKVRDAFLKGNKTLSVPANAKGIGQLKDLVEQIAVSDVYSNNVLPFQTDEYKRKIKRLKEAQYKKKDPFGVYKALQKYKTEVFPGDYSKRVQIQHGDAKFTAQTLSKMGLIDAAANISPEVEKAERLRNNALKKTLATLDNPNASVAAKKAAADEFNSIAKGLRGQLKGTPGQGFVNFQLLEVDDSGNYKKLKDISFDPKKGLIDSDLDLSKITKEQADDLIARGKKKLDVEAVKLKTGLNLKTASQAPEPEKSKTRNMFKKFGKYAKQIAGPTIKVGSRIVGPFVPVLGYGAVGLGAMDTAKAAEQGFTDPDELALAYLAGPEAAKGLDSLKDRVRGQIDETEEFVP